MGLPAQRPRRLRRTIALLAAALLLGCGITVGVAWACVSRGELRVLHGQMVRPARVREGESGSLAPAHLDWPAAVPAGWGEATRADESEDFGLRWRGGAAAEDLMSFPRQTVEVLDAGWPLPALRWTRWRHAENSMLIEDRAIGVGPLLHHAVGNTTRAGMSSWGWFAGEVPRRLPLAPVWSGFLADALIFAGVLLAVLAGPAILWHNRRRIRRRRRGLCEACGYDLRGLAAPCPECGAGRDAEK